MGLPLPPFANGDKVIEIPDALVYLGSAVLISVVLWDAWASTHNGSRPSISDYITIWSARWPALPFAAGFLCGHLFWRRPP